MTWKARILALLLICGVAALVRNGREGDSSAPLFLDLSKALSNATLGPIIGPSASMDSFSLGPYLGFGWNPGRDGGRITIPMASGSVMRFYLLQNEPLTISLEAECAQGPIDLPLTLNGKPWRSIKVQNGGSNFHLDADPEELRIGLNTLVCRPPGPLAFRAYRVEPRNPGRGVDGRLADARAGDKILELPFGRSLHFAIEFTGAEAISLAWDRGEAWIEPGAPSLDSGVGEIVVRHRGSASGDESWVVPWSSAQRLVIPHGVGMAELSLTARATRPVAPGQVGLRLRFPRILRQGGPITPFSEAPQAPPTPPAPRPSVILYLIDTLRADHLGCYGYRQSTSPNIDAFAKESILFANCQAQSSWTKPATASILTSMLPNQHLAIDYPDQLSPSATSLAEILRAAGFRTGGLVTNGFVSGPFGFARGFDEFEYHPGMSSRDVADRVKPWLAQQSATKPFFLYLHTIDPHMPYGNPAEPAKSFKKADEQATISKSVQSEILGTPDLGLTACRNQAVDAYDAAIRSNDAGFKRLLEDLKQLHLYDNTIIVVVSDHGEELLDHGRLGHAHSLYQELLHVPFIVRMPHGMGGGTTVRQVWQQIDVVPTILAALGLAPPLTAQGQAYFPGRLEAGTERPALSSLKAHANPDVFSDHKVSTEIEMDGVRMSGWILQRVYASWDPRLEPIQLFDLEHDPGEKENLAFRRPEITVKLASMLPHHGQEATAISTPGREEVSKILRSLQYDQ